MPRSSRRHISADRPPPSAVAPDSPGEGASEADATGWTVQTFPTDGEVGVVTVVTGPAAARRDGGAASTFIRKAGGGDDVISGFDAGSDRLALAGAMGARVEIDGATGVVAVHLPDGGVVTLRTRRG
jgi:hypothetical protein